MSRFRRDNRIFATVILLIIILMLACMCLIMWFKTGEEASVGIFSLAVTLLGTIFIAVELKNGQNVTCSDMLIDLNNYFHDSDRLMKVYEALECQQSDPDRCARLWEDIKDVEVAHYCTFFENLYLLYRNDVAAIEDLDDLFGYRFFIFVNNPYIQEHYILPTSSSYAQIFKLYDAWVTYRRKKGDPHCLRRIPYHQYMFTPAYLKEELYLNDSLMKRASEPIELNVKGRRFTLRELSFEDISEALALQDECVSNMNDHDLYCPLTRSELIESLHVDKVCGVFTPDKKMVAVAVLVLNRTSPRNLAMDGGFKPTETYTFDAVYVAPQWRGYGLQGELIKWAITTAERNSIGRILTTVSPNNMHSLRNFHNHNFKVLKTMQKYGGHERRILELKLF